MDLHVVPGARGEGVYRLLDELSERHLQLLETLAAEEIDAEPNDDGTLNEQLRDEITLSVLTTDAFGCWWFDADDCNHDNDCDCGPVTLLEVLMYAAPADRQLVFDAHIRRVSELWDHFWSGDALSSGSSSEIGAACAECLVDASSHLPQLYNTAAELAEEIGEAMAAFRVSVALGQPRWPA